MKRWAEPKLLGAFGLFLILIFVIGLIGILQIQSLTRIIGELGERNFVIEKAILGMKINNTLYAMGVRNFVFWKTSRYLEAISAASDINPIQTASQRFDQNLALYSSKATRPYQKEWIGRLRLSVEELRQLADKIMHLAEAQPKPQAKKGTLPSDISKLFMAFENKLYRIDDFLTETLSRSNFKEIDAQLKLARRQDRRSVLLLVISLLASFLLGGSIARFVYRSLKQERQRRQQLTQRMISLQEQERRDLSRQLHDQLSQDLSGLKIYLGLLENELPADLQQPRQRLAKSKQIVNSLLEGSHNISQLLRPSELDELGLAESIAGLILRHKEMTGCNYEYKKPPTAIKLPSEHRLTLYRAAQEALTNIAKHAQADNVVVSLQKKKNTVCLTVTDDGKGFDYQQFLSHRRRSLDRCLGLLGLKERVELLGGVMRIETAVGRGTRIIVELSV
jgi:signal transduction histidine kinase